MTSRTIVAASMQQAMLQAKRELGDAAIMLQSRRVGDQFEVTVTDDASCLAAPQTAAHVEPAQHVQPDALTPPPDPLPKIRSLPASTPPATLATPAPSRAVQPLNPSGSARNSNNNEPALQKLLGELHSFGAAWENIGGRVNTFSDQRLYPGRQELRARIANLQLTKSINRELLQSFREIADVNRAWQLAITQLHNRLRSSNVDVIGNGGAYVFVGPSGAGKTATISKLATAHVLAHGAASIALLTTDTFRFGAGEQLLKLGQILGIEVMVVDSPRTGIGAALAQLAGKTTVLIDSAGLGSGDADLAGQLADIRRQGERLNSLLVMPANMQYASMRAAYETYRVQPYAGCVFTKLDECNSLGATVSLAWETGLPLAYITRGHAIPEDLSRVDAIGMVENLLSCAGRDNSVVDAMAGVEQATAFARQLQLQL